MSILDQKKQVFGKIAANKTLTEGMPNLKLNSSFPSVNNKTNSITFLTDLIKSLIGYAALVKTVVGILIHTLENIEKEIKSALKVELKSIVSCGIDPSLPPFIKSSGSGIIIEVKKIDFLSLLKVDPNSAGGKLLYNDITPTLTNSTDFNTFLYGLIQNDGVTSTWKGIFDITFNSIGVGTTPNNTITIKANASYDSKTLNDLNNNFINSLKLFNTGNIVSKIIDIIFGSISFKLSKSRKQLDSEEKINTVIDKMIDDNANDTVDESVDDSYFEFSNSEISVIEKRSNEKRRGVIKIKTSKDVDSSISSDTLNEFTEEIKNTTTTEGKTKTLSDNLDRMADESAVNVDNKDKDTVKLNFIQMIINNLLRAIIGVILSPKVVIIFLVNYRIINGPTGEYTDAIDFIKKNKVLFNRMMKKITVMIVKILLAIAMKKIAKLVAESQIKTRIEKNKNKLTQILSLVGIPQEVISKIKSLTQ